MCGACMFNSYAEEESTVLMYVLAMLAISTWQHYYPTSTNMRAKIATGA